MVCEQEELGIWYGHWLEGEVVQYHVTLFSQKVS